MSKPDEDSVLESIYLRIRARLFARTVMPGKLLQITALAEEFEVSITPVREALTRLAAERVIAAVPGKGFFSKVPTGEDLAGMYIVNQVLLESAVSRWPHRSGARADSACHDGAAVVYPAEGEVAQHRVQATATLFLQVAARCGIGEIVQVVRNLNDRLHEARLMESAVIDDTHEELSRLAALQAAGRRAQLKAAIRVYHERRVRLAAQLCKELLVESLLSGRRR